MKFYLDMVGCRLNQAEIERMARQIRAAGHEIAAAPQDADLAIINTCAVTSAAAADSRGKIRRAVRAGVDEVIATGCWATIAPEQAAALPGVRRVVPNEAKDSLLTEAFGLPAYDLEPIAREPLPGLRQRTRAFIKAQDGCDNACTFCITTVARGDGRSEPLARVLADIRAAQAGGVQEVVLTGVHLGSWGREFGLHLRDLVAAVLRETDVPRLRLSSLEPWDLDAEFFALWQDPRLCPHLHLPLQSGSDTVLRRMRRHTTRADFRALVAAARAVSADMAITTDVIAGFPGESEDEFAQTLDFVREIGFAGGHVFTYSPRPGTPAARMKGQLPKPVRKARNAALRAVFAEMAQDYARRFIGQTRTVLWETALKTGPQGWLMSGLSDNYLRVQAWTAEPRWNRLDQVYLESWQTDYLSGKVVP